MYSLLFVLCLVVVATTNTLDMSEREDVHVLRSANEAFRDASRWENLFALIRDATRYQASEGNDDEWAHLLARNVRYASHGHGDCIGLQQVIECLVSEQHSRERQRTEAGSVEFQAAVVRQGGVEVVRLLEVHRMDDEDLRRQLDVYFLHIRNGRIWLLEKLPTVRDPIRLGSVRVEDTE